MVYVYNLYAFSLSPWLIDEHLLYVTAISSAIMNVDMQVLCGILLKLFSLEYSAHHCLKANFPEKVHLSNYLETLKILLWTCKINQNSD